MQNLFFRGKSLCLFWKPELLSYKFYPSSSISLLKVCKPVSFRPRLVLNILPTGAVGLMLAVMMAAIMSSLSSAFNSSSTIFTIDIWKLFRPRASERELLVVGQIVVASLVVIAFVWIPIVSSKS